MHDLCWWLNDSLQNFRTRNTKKNGVGSYSLNKVFESIFYFFLSYLYNSFVLISCNHFYERFLMGEECWNFVVEFKRRLTICEEYKDQPFLLLRFAFYFVFGARRVWEKQRMRIKNAQFKTCQLYCDSSTNQQKSSPPQRQQQAQILTWGLHFDPSFTWCGLKQSLVSQGKHLTIFSKGWTNFAKFQALFQ
jgi:hypothetical protein